MNEHSNDTHTTDGEQYRIPAHPDIISALGRAVWNFLCLEESVVAVLYEPGTYDLPAARSLMPGGKENALVDLKSWLGRQGASNDVLDAAQTAIEAFRLARREYRNALLHASPFISGYDENGTYLPGLVLSGPTGQRFAHSAGDLHAEAHHIEHAIDPLSNARTAIRRFAGFAED
jgi:hypothetical protein